MFNIFVMIKPMVVVMVNFFLNAWVQGWKRKGHNCYRLTDKEQTSQDARMGYHCKAPLATVEDRSVINL